ncbi:hypothetical protein CVT25_004620 [Psilocybe cyanescens]|uniref:Uncharacterized protein n=1 Tax=Psilocybe cyanescens TaxID=93625 RepID=A0A409W4E7_PSICY|nr:hypothetical protein CVT25_004620 [Psilocybe cyanescens]
MPGTSKKSAEVILTTVLSARDFTIRISPYHSLQGDDEQTPSRIDATRLFKEDDIRWIAAFA